MAGSWRSGRSRRLEPDVGGAEADDVAVAEAMLAGPLQVAVAGDGPAARELLRVARASTSPGLVTAHGSPDAPGIPLLANRPQIDGKPAAYLCRGFVCDHPVTTPEQLASALAAPLPPP